MTTADPPGADISLPFPEAKRRAVEAFERDYVSRQMEASGGNISEAARRSGLDRANFRRVLAKYRRTR